MHCGSVSPANWIKSRKGDKSVYSLKLNVEVLRFLESPLLVPVQKVGDPPKRTVVDGPRTSDASKAARCCVDWAIKPGE